MFTRAAGSPTLIYVMVALSEEERIELGLLSGREGWSQTLCFYHLPRL